MSDEEEVFNGGMSEEDSEFVSEEESEQSPAAMKTLREKLKKAVAEKQEYLEGWQRARAELANSTRMFEEDKKSAKASGMIHAVEALLPALVSLERAKEAGEIPTDFVGIEKQIQVGFTSLGVKRITPNVGDRFSPETQEALREVPTDASEKDHTIEAILATGYSMGERIVQPAQVSVFVYRA
jgi:molecular chaperone GrpE